MTRLELAWRRAGNLELTLKPGTSSTTFSCVTGGTPFSVTGAGAAGASDIVSGGIVCVGMNGGMNRDEPVPLVELEG
jgi:hypothetical protein